MALNRRTGQRFQASIWPGFVDAMTALLLVLMFVLSIFMIVQFMLRETITGQKTELNELNLELSALADALGLERRRGAEMETRLAAARAETDAQSALIASLNAQVAEARDQITTFETQVAGLLVQRAEMEQALTQARTEVDAQAEAARLAAARRDALEALVADLRRDAAEKQAALGGQVADLEAKLSDEEAARLAEAAAAEALRARLQGATDELTAMTLALEEQRKKAEDTLTLLAAARAAADQAEAQQLSEADKNAALLAVARAELDQQKAVSEAGQRKVELLNQQVAALRAQLGSIQNLLDAAAQKDVAAKVQIETLGSQLNSALAQVASEQRARAVLEEAERKRLEAEAERLKSEAAKLENYRSEFFGRLREVLAGREGVQIVGDRFVFSSEVLFQPGSADLSPEGQAQIARVAGLLRDISGQIPASIDWIIRVDGHTDNVPLSGSGQYRDNWELSQGRALSVVRYMTDELGFPADRLAATGFGEYQPVNPDNTAEARAQNRRIELKLTER
ncbi:peptidoglycan -binding protein [Actibacterium sp.]|uniref:peptidoglycan -binding protein n=1 Tax=Actibacterium sp. TaxID=1872125 RepID=UPI003567C8F8